MSQHQVDMFSGQVDVFGLGTQEAIQVSHRSVFVIDVFEI